jgi:hypothetical protein
MKGASPAPPVSIKVLIQSQNIRRAELIGGINEARIGKGRGQVAVLPKYYSHSRSRLRKLKWNLKDVPFNIFNHCFGSPREFAQQIATLSDNSLAGHQRSFQAIDNSHALVVIALASVEQSDNYPGVQ